MYDFTTCEKLLKLAQKHDTSLSEIVIRYECAISDNSRNKIIDEMKNRAKVMKNAINKSMKDPEISVSGMTGESTKRMKKFFSRKKKNLLLSEVSYKAMMYAIATGETNASMGCIVAFPTAGASGVIPGAFFATQEKLKCSDKKLIEAMFTASGIGLTIAENATLAGSKGGCQAEIGSAVAMAAAGLTEMRGGTPEQCMHAAALGLKNLLGLTCDPVGGMVEVPCVKRGGLAATFAISASDLAMSGVESFIPIDEVIDAMGKIGRLLSPKLRETALGGLAVSKTAMKTTKKLGIKIVNNF
ncbi:MAG: L-serine ammonia-lyase, iron-sulfur-dependent, subunit alpha [Patescibacteria group bacterium]|nr:L-serine ammonia-lyase, iron-sulfur-dependent, subunit alpha [Patescibacteria group bacterium]